MSILETITAIIGINSEGTDRFRQMVAGLSLSHAGLASSTQGRLFPLILLSRTLISLLSGRSKCLPFANMKFLGMENAVFRCQKCLNDFTKEFDSCPMCGGAVEKYEQLEEEVVPLFSELDLPFILDPSKHQYKIITQKIDSSQVSLILHSLNER